MGNASFRGNSAETGGSPSAELRLSSSLDYWEGNYTALVGSGEKQQQDVCTRYLEKSGTTVTKNYMSLILYVLLTNTWFTLHFAVSHFCRFLSTYPEWFLTFQTPCRIITSLLLLFLLLFTPFSIRRARFSLLWCPGWHFHVACSKKGIKPKTFDFSWHQKHRGRTTRVRYYRFQHYITVSVYKLFF